MRVRHFVIAIAATALAGAAAAEPSKAPVRNADQAAGTQAAIVVASVEARTPTVVAEVQAPAAAKRVRTGRTSSCRCGGQTPTAN